MSRKSVVISRPRLCPIFFPSFIHHPSFPTSAKKFFPPERKREREATGKNRIKMFRSLIADLLFAMYLCMAVYFYDVNGRFLFWMIRFYPCANK